MRRVRTCDFTAHKKNWLLKGKMDTIYCGKTQVNKNINASLEKDSKPK